MMKYGEESSDKHINERTTQTPRNHCLLRMYGKLVTLANDPQQMALTR